MAASETHEFYERDDTFAHHVIAWAEEWTTRSKQAAAAPTQGTSR